MTGNNRRGIILQDRDRRLFEELAMMRVADREQIKCAAGFGSTTRVNVRLLALTKSGLLRRFFQGTGGGSRKALYSISQRGADVVQVPFRGVRRSSDRTVIADFFVAHQLRINDLYCRLKFRSGEGTPRFVRWVAFHEPLTPSVSLIPDGYLEVATSETILPAFLEVDLGNESRAVWREKVQAYVTYATSGDFRTRFQQTRFRTLVVAESERRVASLRKATAALTEKIFWFTTFDAIERQGFWSPIWTRPTNDEPHSLVQP